MCDTLISTIVGGVIGFISSFVFLIYQGRKDKKVRQNEYKKYLFEKREPVYLDLAGVLSNIPIPIGIDEENRKVNVDVDELNNQLEQIKCAIEANKNAIALYMPMDVQLDLTRLHSEIYTIITDKKKQEVELFNKKEFEKSDIYRAVMHAKNIFLRIRKEVTSISPQ